LSPPFGVYERGPFGLVGIPACDFKDRHAVAEPADFDGHSAFCLAKTCASKQKDEEKWRSAFNPSHQMLPFPMSL
jgi:hypothetical protein